MKSVQILNAKFHCLTAADTVAWARDWIRTQRRGYICTVNVAILMMMRSDKNLQGFVDAAHLTVADGVPIVWASRLFGLPLPERVAGVELIEALSEMAAAEGFKVYLLGAGRSVIEAAAERLRKRYPNLEICGVADGYFDKQEARERARIIRESKPQLLIAGMGVPRQENFLKEHWEELGVNLAIPVGGSFDVIAGVKKRAPPFLQWVGLEWFYRLLQEPRRLWRRYVVTNTMFLYLTARDVLRHRSRARRERSG